MNKTCGIYKITNKILNKSYIGKSIHIEERWKQHLSGRGSLELYKDFVYYGKENFIFEIIEVCKKNELTQKEKYWISHYNTFLNGYNLNDGGDNSHFAIAKTKKEVYCYNLNGEFLKQYESLSDAERQTGINNSNISRAIKTQGRTKEYLWSYEKLANLTPYKRKVGVIVPKGKKVEQLDLNGNVLNQFESLKQAEEATGVNLGSISLVCNNKRKTAGGYIWRFI